MNPVEIVPYNPEVSRYTEILDPFNDVNQTLMDRCKQTFAFLEAARFFQIFLDASFKNLHSFFPVDSRNTTFTSTNKIDPEHHARIFIQTKQNDITTILKKHIEDIFSFLAYVHQQEKETQAQLLEFNRGLKEWETVIARHGKDNHLETVGQESAEIFNTFKDNIGKFRKNYETLEKTHNLILQRSGDINRHTTATNSCVSSWDTTKSLLGDRSTTTLSEQPAEQNFYPGEAFEKMPQIGKCTKHKRYSSYLNAAEPLLEWHNAHFCNLVSTICDLFKARGIFQFEELLEQDSSSTKEKFTTQQAIRLEESSKVITSYRTVIENITEQLKIEKNTPADGFSIVCDNHNNGIQSKRNVLYSLMMNLTFIESLHQAIETQGKKILAEMNPPSTDTASTSVVFSIFSYFNPFKGSAEPAKVGENAESDGKRAAV